LEGKRRRNWGSVRVGVEQRVKSRKSRGGKGKGKGTGGICRKREGKKRRSDGREGKRRTRVGREERRSREER
jgi:hypothetical protein